MRRGKVLGVGASLCLLLGGAACGGDDGPSEEDLVDQISQTLQDGADTFDEETADCFAQIVVDDVGVEKLKDVDLSAKAPPEDLQDEIAAATVRAGEECDTAGG